MAKDKTDIISPQADFAGFLREVRKKDRTSSSITGTDEKFAHLTDMPGWTEFKKLAEKRMAKLRGLIDFDASGKSLEDLGFRFLVADLAAGEIERLINRVETSRKAYTDDQKEQREKES